MFPPPSFDAAAWVDAYESKGGTVEVLRIGAELFLASMHPREPAGYWLDQHLADDPRRMAAVCAYLAEARGATLSEGAPPFHTGLWLAQYRDAGGKADAYVYSGDSDDPRDPWPVLQLTHAPNTRAAGLAAALTAQQRDRIADHVAQMYGATTAFGRRN